MELPCTDDYAAIFVAKRPLLDVRAPTEFAAGAFPRAENQPLLDDDQRHQIGIRYKEAGPPAAVELGRRLINGKLRDERIAAWRDFASRHPNGVVYCFRGGERSHISQRWLAEETGLILPLVTGGYKALRRFLLESLESLPQTTEFIVLGGRTGTGKTLLLSHATRTLDLEHLAWHRGSAFGRHATAQPTQIDFENRLAARLLELAAAGSAPILVEDESRNIGSLHIPQTLFDRIADAPLLLLEASLEERIEITKQEYVRDTLREYQQLLGPDAGFDAWSAYLRDSLDRVQRRLGGARHTQIKTALLEALEIHHSSGDQQAHENWIAPLLSEYYDPMYDFQLRHKAHRIAGTGTATDLLTQINESIAS